MTSEATAKTRKSILPFLKYSGTKKPQRISATTADPIRPTLGLDLARAANPISSTPEEMATFMRAQQERYGSIIKAQGIKAE